MFNIDIEIYIYIMSIYNRNLSQYIQQQACSGKELKKMFLEHGSFESLEIRIKKKHIESQSRAKSGGWYTKGQLEGQHQWTKTQPQFCKMLWKLPYRLMHFYQIPILGTKENGGTCLSMGRAK